MLINVNRINAGDREERSGRTMKKHGMLFSGDVEGPWVTSRNSYSISDRDLIDSMLISMIPEKHTFDNFMDVAFLLEELLRRKVKVVTPETFGPHLGPHILRDQDC